MFQENFDSRIRQALQRKFAPSRRWFLGKLRCYLAAVSHNPVHVCFLADIVSYMHTGGKQPLFFAQVHVDKFTDSALEAFLRNAMSADLEEENGARFLFKKPRISLSKEAQARLKEEKLRKEQERKKAKKRQSRRQRKVRQQPDVLVFGCPTSCLARIRSTDFCRDDSTRPCRRQRKNDRKKKSGRKRIRSSARLQLDSECKRYPNHTRCILASLV